MNIDSILEKYNFLIGPVVFIFVYFILRLILTNVVKKWEVKDPKNKRNWLFIAKQIPNIILVIFIFIVWGTILKDLAISLVAFAAAIVLATKEVILCFMGGLLKASTNLFEIYDRINIAGFRGKVRDHNLTTTELLEIGPGMKSNQTTGRIIKIPNSLFLTNTVAIVPSGYDFIIDLISLTLPLLNIDLEKIETELLNTANESVKKFEAQLETYKKANPEAVRQFNLNQPPKVFMDFNAKDSFDISLKLCLPYEGMSRIENEIKINFMKKVSPFFKHRN